MAAGDTTEGRRRPDGTEPHELKLGEYALATAEAQVVWLCSPAGKAGRASVAAGWTITVEDDGTVTVDPSIWWDKTATPPGWHGYLERGVWREV